MVHILPNQGRNRPPLAEPDVEPKTTPEAQLRDLLDRGLVGAERASQLTLDGLKTLSSKPLFRPTLERGVHHKITKDVLQDRVVPLLTTLLEREITERGEVAGNLGPQLTTLLEEAKRIQGSSADALQSQASSFGKRLTKLLDDVDYVTVGTLGVVGQLRAANAVLQTSKVLWTSIRTGFALKDPGLRRQAMSLATQCQSVLGKADLGHDVKDDLQRLESEIADFSTRLEEKVGPESFLGEANDVFTLAQGVWRIRDRSVRIFNELEGREGPRTSQELIHAFETHGVPEPLVQEIVDEELLPVLTQIFDSIKNKKGPDADALREMLTDCRTLALSLVAQLHRDPTNLNALETKTKALSAKLDEALTLAEKVVKPLDGPVRRLHNVQRSLGALRALFVTLRAVELSQDNEFHAKILGLQPRLESVLNGQVDKDAAPAVLAAIEADLRAIEQEMQQKLQIDELPAAKQIFHGMEMAIRTAKVRVAADRAIHDEMRIGLQAASDLTMSKEERGARYDAALGTPLVETVVGVSIASRELGLDINLKDLGAQLDTLLQGGAKGEVSPLLAKSPLAFLAEADFESAFERVGTFFDNVDTPEAKQRIDNALDVFRAIYEVERDSVSEMAVVVPEGERVRVGTALAEYASKSTVTLLAWLAEQVAEPSGEAMAEFLDLMVDDSARGLDALGGTSKRDDFAQLSTSMRHYARDRAGSVGMAQVQLLGSRVDNEIGGAHGERLREYGEELRQVLEVLETTDESRAATKHVLEDLRSSVKMAVNLTHLFGAASNANMDPQDRQRVVQQSVERMGPVFIKMMQTLVNMQPLLRSMYPDADLSSDDILVDSLRKLQDDVTPIAWPQIEQRLLKSLEVPDGVPLVDAGGVEGMFVSIDKTPIKSGSIGQLHRAVIRTQDANGHETKKNVVVKVLRPGIEEAFEDTVRVTRLTLSIFSQLLELDKDGNIFGPMKAEAERRLPLIEKALHGFIESFRVETNFSIERNNLEVFGQMYASDRNVAIPEVFDKFTKGGVLTMEELRGHKLSEWIDWHKASLRERPLVEEQGALSNTSPRYIEERAQAWFQQTKGLPPTSTRIIKRRGRYAWVKMTSADGDTAQLRLDLRTGKINARGANPSRESAERKAQVWARKAYGRKIAETRSWVDEKNETHVAIRFDDGRNTEAHVVISGETGELKPKVRPPDMSRRGVAQLRDRLRQACITQLVRGMLHADPHEGNFFIMPDGETIGLFDFGLALKLGLVDARGPMSLMAGAMMNDPKHLAKGMLELSTKVEDGQADRRQNELSAFYKTLLKEVNAQIPLTGGLLKRMGARISRAKMVLSRSLEAVSHCDIVPKPRILHALKATMSMIGNMARFEGLGLRKTSKLRKVMLFAKSGLKAALAPLVGDRLRARKRRQQRERVDAMLWQNKPVGARAPPSDLGGLSLEELR